MSWQLLTAISVLSLSISVILQRTLIHRDKTDPFAYAVVFQGIVGILLMTVAIIVGFKLDGIRAVMFPAVTSIFFYGVGHILYAKTLQKVEASAFSVLFATQAVWIMILGIVLLKESINLLQVFGTMLIFSGVSLLVKNIRSIIKDAGPLVNLALAFVSFGILALAGGNQTVIGGIAETSVLVNLGFFAFNILPIPPLDGSRVMYALAPDFIRRFMDTVERYGLVLVFVLVMLSGPLLGSYMVTVIEGCVMVFSRVFGVA
jgi:Zn-dependent protease